MALEAEVAEDYVDVNIDDGGGFCMALPAGLCAT